ncbi:MAG TPA: hypothetical protein V6C72_11870 [Chroococcales cyanobacterium]
MKRSFDSNELQSCVCQVCDETFLAIPGDDVCCPKCGEREALIFESEEESEERRGNSAPGGSAGK